LASGPAMTRPAPRLRDGIIDAAGGSATLGRG
jgi:hypothetical protein